MSDARYTRPLSNNESNVESVSKRLVLVARVDVGCWRREQRLDQVCRTIPVLNGSGEHSFDRAIFTATRGNYGEVGALIPAF